MMSKKKYESKRDRKKRIKRNEEKTRQENLKYNRKIIDKPPFDIEKLMKL